MVPLVAFGVAGWLISRYGPAVVIALGCLAFSAGVGWWALAISVRPDYVSGALGGMMITGIGVGLTLPTMMAAGSSSLPPQSFATGSAVINMLRQTGLALGVAVLVAVLGNVRYHGSAVLGAFQHAWWVTAALSFASIVPALALLRNQRQTTPEPSETRT
jgi:MFS family permease